MAALKSLVVFMAILIAIGVTVVGVTVYRRATDMTVAPSAADVSPARPSAAGFAARDLDLPAGGAVVSVQALDSRVLVHVRLLDGSTRILVLDPVSGATVGEWRAAGVGSSPP